MYFCRQIAVFCYRLYYSFLSLVSAHVKPHVLSFLGNMSLTIHFKEAAALVSFLPGTNWSFSWLLFGDESFLSSLYFFSLDYKSLFSNLSPFTFTSFSLAKTY